MFYDPRISLGMLFTLIGTVLTAFGLATRSNPDVYAKSMGIDANLWWGLVLLVFGILVLTLGRRGQMKQENIEK
jgi:multisubunit Na+/H+ antiporter MnhG subunit